MACDFGPYVEIGGGLHVRMTELENNLRVAGQEALFVANPPSQDERVIVEAEVVACIEEQHLPQFGRENHVAVVQRDAEFLRRHSDECAIFEERFGGCEAVGLEDQLALKVLDLIE